jgi:hypothetical protein
MGSSSIVVSNLEGSAPKTPGLALRLQALDEGTMLPAHLTVDASTKPTASDSHGGNGGHGSVMAGIASLERSPRRQKRRSGRKRRTFRQLGTSAKINGCAAETIGMWGLSNSVTIGM